MATEQLSAMSATGEEMRRLIAEAYPVCRSLTGDGVRRTVKIEIDGDTLELSEVSAAEQNRLVDLFVRRHSGDEG